MVSASHWTQSAGVWSAGKRLLTSLTICRDSTQSSGLARFKLPSAGNQWVCSLVSFVSGGLCVLSCSASRGNRRMGLIRCRSRTFLRAWKATAGDDHVKVTGTLLVKGSGKTYIALAPLRPMVAGPVEGSAFCRVPADRLRSRTRSAKTIALSILTWASGGGGGGGGGGENDLGVYRYRLPARRRVAIEDASAHDHASSTPSKHATSLSSTMRERVVRPDLGCGVVLITWVTVPRWHANGW